MNNSQLFSFFTKISLFRNNSTKRIHFGGVGFRWEGLLKPVLWFWTKNSMLYLSTSLSEFKWFIWNLLHQTLILKYKKYHKRCQKYQFLWTQVYCNSGMMNDCSLSNFVTFLHMFSFCPHINLPKSRSFFLR